MFKSTSFNTTSFSTKSWLFDDVAVVEIQPSGGIWKLYPQKRKDEMEELIPILVEMLKLL